MSNTTPVFFREPKLIWLGEALATCSECGAPLTKEVGPLRFIVLMETVHPAPLGWPNAIYRVDGVVPADERDDPAKVRLAVMSAYREMVQRFFAQPS